MSNKTAAPVLTKPHRQSGPDPTTAHEMRPWWRQWSLLVAAIAWIACIAATYPLSHGALPFNRPSISALSFRAQMTYQVFQPVVFFLFLSVIYWLTRRRAVPDMASRAPARGIAVRETLFMWLYGAAVLSVGQLIGRKIFGQGIGLHLNGSLFGITHMQTPQEVWFWAVYNFLLYAAVPYLLFRARGYSREALNLKSASPRNDALVILVVLVLESALELILRGSSRLSGHQLMIGAGLSFAVHLLGTGLPIMIFIYSILMPRYARLTASATTTVLLGALSYAVLHVTEYWTVYDSVSHSTLSVIFVLQTFFWPGLIKSFLTVRTGNAWVHLWAYHAVAPHVTSDTPNIVRFFSIK
jgi:hypothetical protein